VNYYIFIEGIEIEILNFELMEDIHRIIKPRYIDVLLDYISSSPFQKYCDDFLNQAVKSSTPSASIRHSSKV
jgi:hypothetical protein